MRINVLGPLTRTVDEGTANVTCSPRAAILLASLAFSKAPVARSSLIDRLWPQVGDGLPRGRSNENLNGYATEARKVLLDRRRGLWANKGAGSITLIRPGARGERPSVDTDVFRFQLLARSAERSNVEQALDLVRGQVLAELDEDNYPWLRSVRKKVNEECIRLIRQGFGWPSARAEAVVEEFMRSPQGTLLETVEGADAEESEDPQRGFDLTSYYDADAPSLRTLTQLVVPSSPPFYDVDVTLTLRGVDSEHYELTYRLEITAELDEFILGLTTRASLTDLLLAECPDISDSFTCSDLAGRDAVLASLAEDDPPIGIWCMRNHPNGNTHRTRIKLVPMTEEERKVLLGRLDASVAGDVVVVKGKLPGPRGSRRRISYRVRDPRMHVAEHYAFWVADRPTFVRRIVIDATEFESAIHIHPMIGNIAYEWELDNQRCDVLVDNWVVKNQGVFLTW